MKRKIPAIFTAVACVAALPGIEQAIAQDFKSAQPNDQLSEFVGDGVCTGAVMPIGKSPGHASIGRYHAEKTLDGHWIVLRYDEDRSATVQKPYHVIQYIGYDPAKQRFVSVALDNASPGYSTGTSIGWKDKGITFDESTDGKSIVFRDTFIRSGSNVSTHVGSMRDRHGKWIKTDQEDCKPS